MLNQFTVGERPNKKNIKSLDLARKGIILWLCFHIKLIIRDKFISYDISIYSITISLITLLSNLLLSFDK